ncbi:MAG: hypothetical protein LBT09_11300 [Planctomycetaceae bacterium]|nr:hypothetical protein [Planctomycetaceae bacterium]
MCITGGVAITLVFLLRELLKTSDKKGSQSSRLPTSAFCADKLMRAGRPRSG